MSDAAPLVAVLAGGVGASRFLQGLVQVHPPERTVVISNTGDDLEFFGLRVSPDVDIVIYALAGAVNPETGWGLRGDTFHVVEALERYGHERWFNLGDRDLATALHRTELLRRGVPLHEVVADIARAWGVAARILPMSDDRIETQVETPEGVLPFQEYMVRRGFEPEVLAVRFVGAETARPAPGVLEALAEADVIVFAPSNPFVSIGPILAVPGIREAVRAARGVRIAVSPIIAGEVVKGPAAKMLRSLGHEVSAAGVARLYRGLLDVMVIDAADESLRPAVKALGMRCVVTNTLMVDEAAKAALARAVLAAAREGRR